MSQPAHKKLMSGLLDVLGPYWHRARADIIYRTDRNGLIHCITCLSSNFSNDYVPSTFGHVQARRDDFFAHGFWWSAQDFPHRSFWAETTARTLAGRFD
ncbi:hypothetical protein [Sandarakinorhabdus sp. AAP62]|uniref:hypothetical protein n=1 Tax=Sandarakinorhabdus sp. AAP62 TaxID=1248916 RepID=UPI00187C287C|nr:hypothetical protein [Sandarakinorhabdus sp. AAP62]